MVRLQRRQEKCFKYRFRSRHLSWLFTVVMALIFGSATAIEKETDWLIFNPPGSYLGSRTLNQISYLEGVLDALYFVKRSGPLADQVNDCLFFGDDDYAISSHLPRLSLAVVRERCKATDDNFSVAQALIERLITDCNEDWNDKPKTYFPWQLYRTDVLEKLFKK